MAAILPTLATFLLMRLWMQILDLHFNPLNMMALPVILGIAIDDGVHIVHRFMEESGNLTHTLMGTGTSVFLTSFTGIISFGILSLATHQGLASFGLLLGLGLMTALITSLTLLPHLLCIAPKWWLKDADITGGSVQR